MQTAQEIKMELLCFCGAKKLEAESSGNSSKGGTDSSPPLQFYTELTAIIVVSKATVGQMFTFQLNIRLVT